MLAAPLHILGIAGSLRRRSLNRLLIGAAVAAAPENVRIEPFDLADIPLYNGDNDTDDNRPQTVERLKTAIANADAVLFATPEYNHSIPGVLQNAIDWASRPAGRSPLAGKPVGIMGASPGALGTARAQQVLKLVLPATGAYVLPHPGMVVGNARQKFDAEGRLTDEVTQKFLRRFLMDLADWSARVAAPRIPV